MPVIARLAIVCLLAVFAPKPIDAQIVVSDCNATMTNLAFGSVSLRAGTANTTSGDLTISCGRLVSLIGVCVRFGAGSGGAGPQNAPRYMRRADNSALAYDLRLGTGTGADRNSVYVPITSLLGAPVTVPVLASIVSSGPTTATGSFASSFQGQATLQYPVSSCTSSGGTTKAIPSFTVSASVTSLCEVDGATLDFGTIGPDQRGPIDGSATIVVRCTAATPYAIKLGPGTGVGASGPTDRRLTGPAGQLRYGLYQDAARSVPWGDQPQTDLDSTGTAADQARLVYGRIPAGQPMNAGAYADSVLITIEY